MIPFVLLVAFLVLPSWVIILALYGACARKAFNRVADYSERMFPYACNRDKLRSDDIAFYTFFSIVWPISVPIFWFISGGPERLPLNRVKLAASRIKGLFDE